MLIMSDILSTLVKIQFWNQLENHIKAINFNAFNGLIKNGSDVIALIVCYAHYIKNSFTFSARLLYL